MSVLPLNVREERFWIIHIMTAGAIGLLMYIVMNSPTLLNALIQHLFHGRSAAGSSASAFMNICLYGRDFVWGYALMFAIVYLFNETRESIFVGARIVLIFELVFQVAMYFSAVGGTFFLGSVGAMALGNGIAMLVILLHARILV